MSKNVIVSIPLEVLAKQISKNPWMKDYIDAETNDRIAKANAPFCRIGEAIERNALKFHDFDDNQGKGPWMFIHDRVNNCLRLLNLLHGYLWKESIPYSKSSDGIVTHQQASELFNRNDLSDFVRVHYVKSSPPPPLYNNITLLNKESE